MSRGTDVVPFRCKRRKHIGLIGANGEGKSTLEHRDCNPIERWKYVTAGYSDQHSALEEVAMHLLMQLPQLKSDHFCAAMAEEGADVDGIEEAGELLPRKSGFLYLDDSGASLKGEGDQVTTAAL